MNKCERGIRVGPTQVRCVQHVRHRSVLLVTKKTIAVKRASNSGMRYCVLSKCTGNARRSRRSNSDTDSEKPFSMVISASIPNKVILKMQHNKPMRTKTVVNENNSISNWSTLFIINRSCRVLKQQQKRPNKWLKKRRNNLKYFEKSWQRDN